MRIGLRATAALEDEVTALFEQLRDPLFRYLLSMGLGVSDAEEVVQEAFLALFRHLQAGKPRDNLRGWVFRVGHNLALKVRRRGARVQESAEDDAVDFGPGPLEQALGRQREQRIAAAIRALPEQDRACLALRAEGVRYRKIAEILGVSLGTVAASLGRTLGKLARVMADGARALR